MTLHVVTADKFVRPFYYFITDEMKWKDHHFLCLSDREAPAEVASNVSGMKRPVGRYLYCNSLLFWRYCLKADRIIMHGDTMLHFFAMFPWFLRKTSWVIYGQELYSLDQSGTFIQKLKRFVLSKVKYHITHIKGDSDLANQLLRSKAKFIYSPMYLSNVADTANFKPTNVAQKPLKLMVGNSTDPTNNHKGIFEQILPFINDIESVFCPLSYGQYDEYKHQIAVLGKEMFGEKFHPFDEFIPLDDYKLKLADIDIAIFDHPRQEAMGVTITLLSMGKLVYVNPNTTSYESLTRRGFKIFDNNLITKEGLRTNRDVSENIPSIEEYYSKEVFEESWIKISQI